MTQIALVKGSLLDRLQAAWVRSDEIFRLVPEGALLDRPIPLRQPFLFYLGHLPAFAWNKVCRGVLGRPAEVPAFDVLFERGIDPVDVLDYRPASNLEWPEAIEVLRYRDRVREALGHACRDAESRPPSERWVFEMALEHELMHQETLLYMVLQLPAKRRLPAPARPSPAGTGRGRSESKAVAIPAGTAVLGAERGTLAFGWDNEFEAHQVEVPAFAIDALPVTNGAFREFVEAGGYSRRELWSDEAWGFMEARAIAHPPFWSRVGDGWVQRSLVEDRPLEEVGDWPVSVTWAEARAFLLWRGKDRLPTEAEFHRAAYGEPGAAGSVRSQPWGIRAPEAGRGNFGFEQWEPTAVDAHPGAASAWGVHELVGNGWEWTTTPFGPFPGFTAHPAYPEYSRDFFDGRHYVMLGASWATDSALVRRSFRNWFQAHYPYVFAKFRGVSPP